MAKAVWHEYIADSAGNVLSNAQIDVYDKDGARAVLHEDRDGLTPLGNPFFSKSTGLAEFYTDPGRYRIEVQKGSSTALWENELIGTVADGAVDRAKVTSDIVTQVPTIADLRALTGVEDGQQVSVKGAGLFSYNATLAEFEQIGAFYQPSDITVTVGSGGDFPSINEAIDRLESGISSRSSTAEIKILAGTVIAEQIHVKSKDLSWITITAEDAEVPVDREALTENDPDPTFSTVNFMLGYRGAALPTIGCIFNINTNGLNPTNSRGLHVRTASKLIILPNCGIRGNVDRLVEVAHGSIGIARLGVIEDGIDIGVRVSNGSVFHAGTATIRNNAGANLACAAIAVVAGSTMTGSGLSHGIRATGSGDVEASSVDVSGCDQGVRCNTGGSVNFQNGVANDCGTYAIYANAINSMVSAPNVTAMRAGDTAVYAEEGARINVSGSGASLADSEGRAIFADYGGEVIARLTALTGAASFSILAERGARVFAHGASVSTSFDRAVSANNGAFVSVTSATISPTTGDEIEATGGGEVIANGASFGSSSPRANRRVNGAIVKTNDVVENQGSATIPSGSLSVDVNHGLSFAPVPGQVQVTPASAMGAASTFRVVGLDATKFTIAINADAGQNTVFAWSARV